MEVLIALHAYGYVTGRLQPDAVFESHVKALKEACPPLLAFIDCWSGDYLQIALYLRVSATGGDVVTQYLGGNSEPIKVSTAHAWTFLEFYRTCKSPRVREAIDAIFQSFSYPPGWFFIAGMSSVVEEPREDANEQCDELPGWSKYLPNILEYMTPQGVYDAVAELHDMTGLVLDGSTVVAAVNAVENALHHHAAEAPRNEHERQGLREYLITGARELLAAAAAMDHERACEKKQKELHNTSREESLDANGQDEAS